MLPCLSPSNVLKSLNVFRLFIKSLNFNAHFLCTVEYICADALIEINKFSLSDISLTFTLNVSSFNYCPVSFTTTSWPVNDMGIFSSRQNIKKLVGGRLEALLAGRPQQM